MSGIARALPNVMAKWRIPPPEFFPDLETASDTAKHCRACHLFRKATQTVFGEGGKNAALMCIGEQPGDQEDLEGKPFVGPAGHLLHELINELKIPIQKIYVTNAVKHFKFERTQKRRLHQKPVASEISACHPWVEAELSLVQPKIVLCLGATAARSILGRTTTISSVRGKALSKAGADYQVILTWHPSSILRAPTPEARAKKRHELKSDLKHAWHLAQRQKRPKS